MRVLAFASQKGGSGKTTLTGHLAVQAERAGHGPVVLIDIDPQGSLSDWWNERTAEEPAFAQTTVSRLAADLEILRQQGFKLAMIDTPPATRPHHAVVRRARQRSRLAQEQTRASRRRPAATPPRAHHEAPLTGS